MLRPFTLASLLGLAPAALALACTGTVVDARDHRGHEVDAVAPVVAPPVAAPPAPVPAPAPLGPVSSLLDAVTSLVSGLLGLLGGG